MMMRELRRYRLFLTFMLVPLFVVVLIIVVIANTVFRGDEGSEPTVATATATATAAPVVVATPVVVAPAPTATQVPTITPPPVATVTPTSIPAFVPTPTSPPAATASPAGPLDNYTIQPGDTLSGIAADYGVTVDELVAINSIDDPAQIAAGAVLSIPAGSSASPAPVETVAPAPSTGLSGTVAIGDADSLNVRDLPSLTGSVVVAQLADGAVVDLTGVTQQVDGVLWYQTAAGNWIHGQFLIVN